MRHEISNFINFTNNHLCRVQIPPFLWFADLPSILFMEFFGPISIEDLYPTLPHSPRVAPRLHLKFLIGDMKPALRGDLLFGLLHLDAPGLAGHLHALVPHGVL